MSIYDAAKKASLLQSTIMIVGVINEFTIVQCMHCMEEFPVEDGSDESYMPNYGHECHNIPVHPRLNPLVE